MLVFAAGAVAVTAGVVALIVYLPFFRITGVVVEGLTSISRDDVISVVNAKLSQKPLFIFPERHRLFINEEELVNTLSEQFHFKSATLSYDRKTMIVVAEESVLEIALRAKNSTYFLTLEGGISREASSDESLVIDVRLGSATAPTDTTLPALQPTMPIIVLGQTSNEEMPGLDSRVVTGVIQVDEGLRAIGVVPISHELIRLEDRWITTHTQTGYDVMIDVTKDIPDQLEMLKTILTSRDDTRYEYIDVRFGENIFVKEL